MATANDVLNIARKEIGYSRRRDPQSGTKYGRWYAKQTGTSYYGQSGVPYCAMFVSWVFAQAGASCNGIPGAYCPWMLNKAGSARLGNVRNAQPGDVVYFDWDGGKVDHVGIIEVNNGSYCTTIEGNTGNGEVLRRTRNWSVIKAVVRPKWSGVSKPAPAPTPSGGEKVSGKVADIQRWLNANYSTGLNVDNKYGSLTKKGLVKALQTELNSRYSKGLKVDGIFGSKTKQACVNMRRGAKGNIIRCLQAALICNGYNTGGFDGIFGNATFGAVKNWQSRHRLAVDGIAGPKTFASLLG